MRRRNLTHRHRQVSRRTITTSVAAAVLILGYTLFDIRNDNQTRAESSIALASLPHVEVAEPDPNRPRYDRKSYQPHGWIDADGDGCNTRREVLIEEALKKPSINPDGCKLSGGEWRDHFDPTFTTTSEREVQIDHLVALADAHRSGAWKWPPEKKIAFANDIEHPVELNVVSNSVNKEKSDKGPDEWMPKDSDSRCLYVSAYVSIKSKWQLTVSPAQWQAISKAWAKCK